MDRPEFKLWVDDLRRRLPEVGYFVATLPEETRDIWFNGIFAEHSLCDAYAVNVELMHTGEGLARYERDRLPSLFREKLKAKRSARTSGEIQRSRIPYAGAWTNTTEDDAINAPCYRELLRRMAAYRAEHGVRDVPDELVHEWNEELWENDLFSNAS